MRGAELAGIMALARAGAVDEAMRRFEAAPVRRDDPAALIVEGRLLKELALRARPDERGHFYRRAAAAYRRSAELQPASYPLINAAALCFVSGNQNEARSLAESVLRSIENHPDEPETPYYRTATRAEALLLLERDREGRAAFAEAISLAPRAWEDHATTLRQFEMILEEQGLDASWLAEHRPPRSLHFGGHMSFGPGAESSKDLRSDIDALLAVENVGFGYGALAAGADIIIAEALVACGAELHAILPGGAEDFAAISVDPWGKVWRRRFNALVAEAETVRQVRTPGSSISRQTIRIADEVAMGAAVMNAGRLESEAIQLLVVDGRCESASGGSGTLEAQRLWAGRQGRQHLLKAPREAVAAPAAPSSGKDENVISLAVVAIIQPHGGADTAAEQWLRTLGAAIAEASPPTVPPFWSSGRVVVAFAHLPEAAGLIVALANKGYRVGADYCAATIFNDPFAKGERLPTRATAAAEAAASSTPPGSACATEDFAAALAARGNGVYHVELVGELDAQGGDSPLALYAVR
jgi:hypothetical protein